MVPCDVRPNAIKHPTNMPLQEHQLEHWKMAVGGHKKKCKRLKAEKEAADAAAAAELARLSLRGEAGRGSSSSAGAGASAGSGGTGRGGGASAQATTRGAAGGAVGGRRSAHFEVGELD